MSPFDELERRSPDERNAQFERELPKLVAHAKAAAPAYAEILEGVEPGDIRSLSDFQRLPVLRKSDLGRLQSRMPPLGGLATCGLTELDYVFQSPGPLYEAGSRASDWWRLGRFIHACGVDRSDIVQNCFSYHLTPAGHMFESAATMVGATVIPAGTGNTDVQVRAAADIGTTAYAGTPDYLKVILDRADSQGVDLSGIKKAAVSAGPLFPTVRSFYSERGIKCLQCYATAEAGNIAYETIPDQGLIIDEGVLLEIVTPGTGQPVESGVVGEVVVTVFNEDYPLIRFATGDLSATMPGTSACGRTNSRIVGWRGRADQTTKVRGMFVRPEQIAAFVTAHEEVKRARAVVTRENEADVLVVRVESSTRHARGLDESLRAILNLRAEVELVEPGALPNDGKVIDDQRPIG